MKEESNLKKIPQVKIASAVKDVLSGSESKITNATFVLMLATAGFYDLFSAIPIVNWLVAVFAWLTFGLWFAILGVGLISPKKFAVWGTSAVVGVIPAISALPELTAAIILTVLIVRAEEKLGFKLPMPSAAKPVKGGRTQAVKAKLKRRMTQTPEHRKESVERLRRRFESSRRQRGSSAKSMDGISFNNTVGESTI